MKHIKKIEFNDNLWTITLHSGATIEGTSNLVETIAKVENFTWPQPNFAVLTT